MAGDPPTGDEFDVTDPYVDAANRLERVIDTQISTLNGIDTKAEHVTRLVAVLLGVILTLVSVSVRVDGFHGGSLPTPVALAGVAGVVSLVLSMATAIVTYLSSTFKMGLHPGVGRVLSDPEHQLTADQHIRRVLGTYGYAVEQNRQVIDANSKRFRWTLVFLLVGISLLTLGTLLFISGVSELDAWTSIGLAVAALGSIGWYVLTGRYLPLERQWSDNE